MGNAKGKKRGKKRIKIFLVIVAFLALLAAAGYTVFIAPLLKKDQWIYKEVLVQKGTLAVGVTESGALTYGITELNYGLDLDTSTDDDDEEDEEEVVKYLQVEEVYVSAGQKITKGDALVKISESSITGVRRQLDSALVEAKTEYNEALADYELSALEANLDYESSLIDSKYAKSIYNNNVKSLNGDVQSLKVQLEECQSKTATLTQKLQDAQDGFGELEQKYKDAKAAWEAADIAEAVNYTYYERAYINAQSSYQNAKDQIKQAKQALADNEKQITTLTRQINASKAAKELNGLQVDGTYQESVLSGENAKVIYDSTMEGLKEDLQKAQDELDQAQKRKDDFEAFVGEDGMLYASEDGIITEVSCTAGQTLERQQTLLTYAKPSEMTISVDVTQEDVVNLAVGDKVSISFTAYPDVPYEGIIHSIETTATSRNTDTVSYTVVVAVEGETDGLYGGMTSDIIFVLEEKEDILYVSRKAIVEEDGKTLVYVKDADGKMVLREVKTGITNGVSIEITEGLQEGETIYLASIVSSATEVTGEAESGNGKNSGEAGDGSKRQDGSMPSGEMPSFDGMPDMENMPDFGGSMPDFGGSMPDFGGSMPDFGGGMPGGGSRPEGGSRPSRNSGGSKQ